MAEEVTTKFKVDISDLKKNISDANRQMKLANAQFKASSSAMEDWGSSADGVSAKIKQMTSILNAQKSKLTAYRSQLSLVEEAYAENGRRAEELREKMSQLVSAGIDPASEEYKQYQRALQDVTREQDANEKAADNLKVTILNQEAALNNTERELNQYENTLKQLESAEKQAANGAKDQKSGYDALKSTINEQQQSLDKLKQSYADAVIQYGRNSTEAKDLKGSIKELSGELATNKQKLKDADKAADDLDNSMDDVDDAARKASDGFTTFKGILANLAADAIRRAVDGLRDLGQAAYEAYKEYDDGADTVIKKTGATGKSAEKLSKVYSNVTKSVVGDFNDMGSAVGEINTRFGFTDKQLEDASVQFLKFAEINGSDVTQSVQLVSRAMGDAGIESNKYGDVLDQLTAASQASGISIEDLTGNLAKYGAPMRALGLDTKESIAIFAGWEKAGVNTEIAFSGMKQAISKWAKDGKDSRKEFKKTLDEIAKCPDIASATTKAIEVFGKKAGPDLADAIKGGRFEYSDFLKLLESSEGTVTETYEATQDGFDKVKLAIQGGRAELGDYISQLADKYSPQIEQFANKTVDNIKKAIKWITENVSTIKTVGSAIATAFTVTKIIEFVKKMTETVSAVKKVATAVKTAESATKLLNAAQAMTPWGLVALAIGGVATALVTLKKEQDKAIEAEYGLTQAQKDSITASEESRKAYEEMESARQESMDAINAEYGYIEELKDEYNSLIDENGKVKEGYESRAEFILNQLASALGVERDEIEKNIDANGKLGESIDKLIQKKQAEALLSANEDAYKKSIQERDKALQTYQKSLKSLDDAEKKYQSSVTESGNVLDTYMGLLKTSPSTANDYYWANQKIIEGQKQSKEAMEKAKQGVEDSEKAYLGYINTISNYEGLSAAIISGDATAIQNSMTAIQNGLITAENGTKESLEKQLKNAEQTYRDMKKASADGMAGVTQKTVDQAKKMVELSKDELAKFNGTFIETFDQLQKLCNDNGVKIPNSVAEGIKSGQYAVPQSVEEMQSLVSFLNMVEKSRQAGIDVPTYITQGIQTGQLKPSEAVQIMTDLMTYNDMLTKANTAGIAVPNRISEGVRSGQMSPAQAVSEINQLMVAEANKSSAPMVKAGNAGGSSYTKAVASNAGGARKAGSELKQNAQSGATGNLTKEGKEAGSSYAKSMSSNAGASKNAGTEIKRNATTGATGNLTKEGKDAGSSYAKAVSSQSGAARNAGTVLKKNAQTGAKGALTAEGQEAGRGYVDGVNAYAGQALSAGSSLKNNATAGAQGGYSGMYSAGSNAAQGFVDGINARAASAASAAAAMVTNAINAAKAAQASHSPSRIWRNEIGGMAGEGYIEGLADKIRPAMMKARSLIKDSIEAASKEMSRNPISLDGFASSLKSSMTYASQGVSVPNTRFGGVAGQNSTVGDTVITYNQTINAPQAPSRIELYRQTRNLLEYAKGGA